MMLYPGRNHGIFGGATGLNLFKNATEYIEVNL